MRTLNEINLTMKDRQAVERAAGILKDGFPVDAVILFGSKARGDDDAESDIDLLVLTNRGVTHAERHAMTEALFDLQHELDVVFSTIVIPRHEWEHGVYQVLPLRQEVERDGATA